MERRLHLLRLHAHETCLVTIFILATPAAFTILVKLYSTLVTVNAMLHDIQSKETNNDHWITSNS